MSLDENALTSGEWTPAGLIALLRTVDRSSAFYDHATRMLDRMLVTNPLPSPPPNAPPRTLTIGMCTYDDFDGVYFSIQALRMYHPEVADEIDFLVIDNHPDGAHGSPVAALCTQVPNCRYFPYRNGVGTATRDLLFRLSTSRFVMCMDSHVLLAPGSLRQLLDYLHANPDTNDLLQGPLLHDDGRSVSTHFTPEWGAGMWGRWDCDERGTDPAAPPFDIPMQGLGVFVCRREAWPGFNRRFAGFGGEEGYIHERVRRSGGRTLCLPFLRWMHRFGRPTGTAYPNVFEDRFRNYLLGAHELGDDPTPAIEHFRSLMGDAAADAVVEKFQRELDGPFSFFDAIYCINLDRQTDRWNALMEHFNSVGLGFSGSVRRFPAIETPTNHHIGCALSHRAIIEEAQWQGLRNVMVFEDDVRFSRTAVPDLAASLAELKDRDWNLLYLGGHRWGQTYPLAPGCQRLEVPHRLTCTHAVAYNHTIYQRLLDGIPARPSENAIWLETHLGIDQYYMNTLDGEALVVRPVVATQGSIAAQETVDFVL